jgi:hypothetical protein
LSRNGPLTPFGHVPAPFFRTNRLDSRRRAQAATVRDTRLPMSLARWPSARAVGCPPLRSGRHRACRY